jgi:signal transduction histidine kinase
VNLLSNGIKFTNYSEVVVSFTSKVINELNNSFITQESPQLYEMRFTVKDTGIGIPKDKMYRLLQTFPFCQVDASTTSHYGGTGLGLVIS